MHFGTIRNMAVTGPGSILPMPFMPFPTARPRWKSATPYDPATCRIREMRSAGTITWTELSGRLLAPFNWLGMDANVVNGRDGLRWKGPSQRATARPSESPLGTNEWHVARAFSGNNLAGCPRAELTGSFRVLSTIH